VERGERVELPASDPTDDEPTLLDYAAVVWRHRWMIGGLCTVALAAAAVFSLVSPRVYEATATLLAPKEGPGGGLLGGAAVSALLREVPGLAIPSLTPNRDMLVSLLKSRTLAQAVVDRFGLQARYRARFAEDAVRALQDRTDIKVSREGVISVRVEDTDPHMAAAIANFYVDELDRLVARYGIGEAGRQRVFLTEQLARAQADLEAAENALRRFQERNRAVALQEQTRGAIEAAARLKGEIMAAEVQLQVMRQFATEANPEMVALRRRVEEMRRQLARMQYGEALAAGADRRDFVVPLPRVPEVGLELARLMRDVKVQETLVTLLTQQVEQARLAEARDLPVVQVLDRAVAPQRHVKPRLRLNLALAGVTSLFAGVFLAFFMEYVARLRGRPRPA
jgi:tyrosine-protein kinase Etk/Wzc